MSYEFYEEKTPPSVSWREARKAIRMGVSTPSLFSLPLLDGPLSAEVSDVPLMGTHHNERRITRLFKFKPDGCDSHGRPWKVGIFYEAPDDPYFQFEDLIGVVSTTGHLGCMMPGYHYIKPFVSALAARDMHFVVPVVAADDDIMIPFLRGRVLREALEQLAPPGVTWEWPPWPEDTFEPLTAGEVSAAVVTSVGDVRGCHYTEWPDRIRALKRGGRLEAALELLYECIEAAERDRGDREPAPWYTYEAAVIHRKRKEIDREVAVLQRWHHACPAAQRGPGAMQAKVTARLAAAHQLLQEGGSARSVSR
ncbi:hypothetical protein [Actinoplanes sichuanensis]|uniref:Uncharacterized protein n=1 Tax=Actinoplanes sichuanensis TaxID=512349 RepID=A0ABW4A1B4_9ACTN